MTDLFLKLLNISITASWIVLAVVALRIFLRKAPKWIFCVLWSIVALRLILPFSLESEISLIPSAEVIPQDIIRSETPAIHSGISAINSAVNPLFTGSLTPEKDWLEQGLSVASWVWIAGVAILLLYSLFTYLRIRHQVRGSLLHQKNIYVSDHIASPFILGTILPKIYIPSGMEDAQLYYVLAHENAHLKRLDHWWKPLGFLLLTLYWFNPVLWVAYILLCRDIEMACDEKVIAAMDSEGKRGYSEALIACSMHRRMIMICPVAFGEVSVKSRIKSVLRYKKPALWVALIALVACTMTAGCFLTNPLSCAHRYESEVITDATCTSRGVEQRTCDQCRHMYTAYIDMRAHTYGESVVTVASTCTQPGVAQRSCTQCHATKTAELALAPHTAGETVVVQEPNCTQEGNRSAACVHCGQTVVLEVLPVNDVHDMKETIVKAPTCTEPGEGVSACTRCDHQEPISYKAEGHQYTKKSEQLATCTQPGERVNACTRCGHSESIVYPAKGHQYTIKSEELPDCEKEGSIVYVCTVCKQEKHTSIPAEEHVWKWWYQDVYMCLLCSRSKRTGSNKNDYSLLDGVVNSSKPTIPELPPIQIWP